jgi:hypothetical protein
MPIRYRSPCPIQAAMSVTLLALASKKTPVQPGFARVEQAEHYSKMYTRCER